MKLFHTIVNFITDEWWFYSCCMCLSNSCCWCFLYILYLLCWLGVWVWIIATDCIHVTWEYWKLVNNWILVWNCTCICQWYNIKHSLFRGILQLILQFPWVNCLVHRPDCREAVNRCSATADGGEKVTVCASAYGEQIAVFDRGDAKRAGVRRALTICRTALWDLNGASYSRYRMTFVCFQLPLMSCVKTLYKYKLMSHRSNQPIRFRRVVCDNFSHSV